MWQDGQVPERGESAVVVPVPAVEPHVSSWRERFDSSAAQEMPAHVTVLYPFLPDSSLTPGVLDELRGLCGRLVAFEVEFARTERFPDVLYLAPEPDEAFRELTLAITARWPEAPPYGGVHEDVVPHLTVACADDPVLDGIETELVSKLPRAALLTAARLYVFDGASWQPREELPFQGSFYVR